MIKSLYILLGLMAMTQIVLAQGQQLHDTSCLQCHSSLTSGKPNSLYSRSDRKVTTFAGLQKRVKGCAVAADANWSKAQHEEVVKYLQEKFYHF